jgi:hypothetical protein
MEPSDPILSKTDWLGRSDLLEILPTSIVDRILQGTDYRGFDGKPVVPASELEDRVGLVLRDHNITEGNA